VFRVCRAGIALTTKVNEKESVWKQTAMLDSAPDPFCDQRTRKLYPHTVGALNASLRLFVVGTNTRC